jgi:hypothetical protein
VQVDRLMVWRFPAAPENLKALHCGPETPEWLVLVPAALSGADLDETIVRGSMPGEVARYEAPNGDIVYIGTSQLNRLPESLDAPTRLSAMTAAQARRK